MDAVLREAQRDTANQEVGSSRSGPHPESRRKLNIQQLFIIASLNGIANLNDILKEQREKKLIGIPQAHKACRKKDHAGEIIPLDPLDNNKLQQ